MWNLQKLAKIGKFGDNLGKVIDKLTREKMLSLRSEEMERKGEKENGKSL